MNAQASTTSEYKLSAISLDWNEPAQSLDTQGFAVDFVFREAVSEKNESKVIANTR